MSRKHVHDRIDRLARRLADAEAELAALRAWKDSHACFPLSYQPMPIPPAQPTPLYVGDVPPYGGYITTTGAAQSPFISTVTIPAGQWTAINTAGAAPTASTLHLVWPPKNPPDDPDMGVPAIV